MFSASKLVTDAIYTNLVAKPTLFPEEALAAFRGEDPNGTWTLTIADDEGGDTGSLVQWQLEIFSAACPP
jgi:subtilisin-like proprotein convertase family protein